MLSNPGVFSHDELQRKDFLDQNGALTYLQNHLKVSVGDSFSFPVRPFSFFIQGMQSFFLQDFPYIFHLFGVLTTGLAASLFFTILLTYGFSLNSSLTAALIFIILPTSTLATGWAAALMDQWYVIFGLLGLFLSIKFVNTGKPLLLVGVLATQVLALLSKETAIALPFIAFVAVIAYRAKPGLRPQHFLALQAAWFFPLAGYLLYRLPAIVASLSGGEDSGYSTSILNIPKNLILYFSYPFNLAIGEIATTNLSSPTFFVLGVGAHLVLLISIIRLARVRVGLLYIFGFFSFLGPVMLISGSGSHYLFGSGLALSAALAYLVHQKSPGYLALSTIFLVLLIAHSVWFQTRIYLDGICSEKILTSLESSYKSLGSPNLVQIEVIAGEGSHVANRILFARNQIGEKFPVILELLPADSSSSQGKANIRIESSCLAVPMSK